MNSHRWYWILFGLALLVACGPAATPHVVEQTKVQTVVQTVEVQLPTEAPISATAFAPTPSAVATLVAPPPIPLIEQRVVELEWPPRMRLGDSDVVRLSLIPSEDGYTVTTEFPDHTTITSTVPVARPGGFDLSAVARLDATGFVFTPEGEQARGLPLDEPVTWRWSLTPRASGQHRLSVTLSLRWTPSAGTTGSVRESQIYSKSLDVRVISFFGLTQAQAAATGFVGLIFGSGLGLLVLRSIPRQSPRPSLQMAQPNPTLVIEPHPSVQLADEAQALMRACFRRYARLVVESEFHSGYSGARTFLAIPIRADGRADAHTIIKIGERDAIQHEFENYETYVKDTLPPVTARIQEPPVTTPTPFPSPVARAAAGEGRAALRYTFIAEPGRRPLSLREALLENPDPSLLEKLFETFGPNWWMQRRPYTFRLAQEYDRMLPAHYVLEPASGRGKILDGRTPPSDLKLEIGDCVTLRHFPEVELRADRQGFTLSGECTPGQPPLRIRWMSLSTPEGATGRVVDVRSDMLRGFVASFDLHGLSDPLERLPALLNENVSGTQSTIHGDLNVENILVGPGGLVWLIDFARTRDGHPLFDFAHLEAAIIAQVIAPSLHSATDYISILNSDFDHPLLAALHRMAGRCLFNPAQPREYHLALCMACLGALKFPTLQPASKHLLYLTAGHLAQSL